MATFIVRFVTNHDPVTFMARVTHKSISRGVHTNMLFGAFPPALMMVFPRKIYIYIYIYLDTCAKIKGVARVLSCVATVDD